MRLADLDAAPWRKRRSAKVASVELSLMSTMSVPSVTAMLTPSCTWSIWPVEGADDVAELVVDAAVAVEVDGVVGALLREP